MPCFKKSVVRELGEIDSSFKIIEDLSPEIMLIETSRNKNDFVKTLLEFNPIFIKHIAPVDKVASTLFSKDEIQRALIKEVEEAVSIKQGDLFCVQARMLNVKNQGIDYNSKDVEVIVGEHFCQDGKLGVPYFSDNDILNNDDVKIISICITPKNTYIGFSKAKENINFHNNEYRICSHKGEREVSRAENKLKEAIVKFNLKLEGGKALDVGAAPGGWTKVLLDNGYEVIAVDPGELSPKIINDKKLTHLKTRIENLNFENEFDIIVNDMNMDPKDSAKIMCDLHKTLKDNAKCVLTIKLPGNPQKGIEDAREALKEKFDILDIKNLFHNRREVTALLRKK